MSEKSDHRASQSCLSSSPTAASLALLVGAGLATITTATVPELLRKLGLWQEAKPATLEPEPEPESLTFQSRSTSIPSNVTQLTARRSIEGHCLSGVPKQTTLELDDHGVQLKHLDEYVDVATQRIRGKLTVRICGAKGLGQNSMLGKMSEYLGSVDAMCVADVHKQSHKTEIVKGDRNPEWKGSTMEFLNGELARPSCPIFLAMP